MLLPQISRSRSQFAIPLLRQSIRIHVPAVAIRLRSFNSTLPRTQDETVSTGETNDENSTQNENPQPPPSPSPSPPPAPPTPQRLSLLRGRRPLVRRTGSMDYPPSIEIDLSPRAAAVVLHGVKSLNQSYLIVRISRLIEALRDPCVLPFGALEVMKIYLNPDGKSTTGKRIILNLKDISKERVFLRVSPNSTQSPLMRMLEITDIKSDSSRYVVRNLREVQLGLLNDLNPEDEPKSDAWEGIGFFFPRRVAENIEAIRKTPKGSNVIIEWEDGRFRAVSMVNAVEKVLGQLRYLTLELRRATDSQFPRQTNECLSWDPNQYRSLLRIFKKTEKRVAAVLNNPLEKPTITVPIGGQNKEVSILEALDKINGDLTLTIEKMECIIDCYNNPGINKDGNVLRTMGKFEKRVNKNIEAIFNSPIEQSRVGIVTMYGKREELRADAIYIVLDQIGRMVRVILSALSDMGYPLTLDSGPFLRPRIPIVRTPIRWIRPIIPTITRYYVPDIGAIPGSRREYSAYASRNYQRSRERGGDRTPWAQNDPKRGFPPDLRARSSSPLSRDTPPQKIDTPKPAPGHSVRDKMVEKEKEQSMAMDGLVYSLLTPDHQEGGGVSVQKAIEKDLFQDVGAWEGGEMGGLTDESGIEPLRKGDMCELRTGPSSQLGIFLRPSLYGEPTSDFLLMTGEISMTQAPRISFAVPSFIPEELITMLINQYDKIFSASGLKPHERNQLVLPRSMMSPILEKVRSFSKESAELFSAKRVLFDELHERLAFKDEPTTITLFEAVEEIFGKEYGDQELYATHLALMGEGEKYMADKAVHRATSTFTVRSKVDVAMIEFVTQHVRKRANKVEVLKKRRGAERNMDKEQLDSFIEKARFVIDLSRKYKREDLLRKNKKPPVERVNVESVVWDSYDKSFIDYVKMSVMKYGSQTTAMEGLVPSILRDVDRYEGNLDAVVGYQFLTEIGAWSPWENLALRQQNITFPGYGTSKVADGDEERVAETDTPRAVERLGLEDCMKDVRKDWGQMEVYCIDDASAHEIDDGISLERVSETENWVHVHIANPTAFLPQNHWLSDVAFRRKQSLYLPERTYPMLPVSLTEVIGMGPNRGVMTISAKINKDGEILDYNVQAGFVRNVKRFTYDAISKALGQPNKETITYQIGELPEPIYERPNTGFSKKQLEDFKTLSKIAIACRGRRVKNGLVECSTPSHEVNVYNGLKNPIHPLDSSTPILYRGHPSIRLTVIGPKERLEIANFMVAEMMQLANHVTARFCGEKNIAAPFRVMEYDYERGDMVKHFTNEILPSRDALGHLNFELGLRYLMFLGQTRLSVTPKPHRLLGFDDGYVRATSPLRRYSDMIAHWQIQAYLLGKTPRTHKQLSNIVPEMDRGERMGQFTSKDSKRFWGAVAVGRILETDKSKLPSSMEFMVMEKQRHPTLSAGLVLDLGMVGKVGFNSKAEEMSVCTGDILRVVPNATKSGEKFVWYDFQSVVRRAEKIM